jgi:cytochrome c oxidase subunit 2
MTCSCRKGNSQISGTAALLAALFCSGQVHAAVLTPQGPAAARITDLWWVMLWLAVAVCVAVFSLLGLALFRPAGAPRAHQANRFVVIGGIVIPAIILLGLLLYSLGATAALAVPARTALTIRITAHQWWWEAYYPEQDFLTANEIHIPTGRTVRLEITASDVIHSFWVPALNGKVDAIPGQVNELWIEAAETGVFQGQCAEFCGLQHGRMKFLVFADPPAAFSAWLAGQLKPAAAPDSPAAQEGLQVFLRSPCLACHTVRGTVARGRVGPDLTHLASRTTLGAGTVSNNRGNLAGWIIDSQGIKPGNDMPPMPLSPADLQALLAWLEGLQ